jgi:hypothetical protein
MPEHKILILTTCCDITEEGIIQLSINGADGFIIPPSTQHYFVYQASQKAEFSVGYLDHIPDSAPMPTSFKRLISMNL